MKTILLRTFNVKQRKYNNYNCLSFQLPIPHINLQLLLKTECGFVLIEKSDSLNFKSQLLNLKIIAIACINVK